MTDPRDRFTSLEGDGEDRRTARARHPSSRRRPDLTRMVARLGERMASEGHPWPDLAAAVLAERGQAGADRSAFARRLGVSEEQLAGIEDGTLA